jgi:hypothetical protein
MFIEKFELILRKIVSSPRCAGLAIRSSAAKPRLHFQKVGSNIPRNLPFMGILSGIKEKQKF